MKVGPLELVAMSAGATQIKYNIPYHKSKANLEANKTNMEIVQKIAKTFWALRSQAFLNKPQKIRAGTYSYGIGVVKIKYITNGVYSGWNGTLTVLLSITDVEKILKEHDIDKLAIATVSDNVTMGSCLHDIHDMVVHDKRDFPNTTLSVGINPPLENAYYAISMTYNKSKLRIFLDQNKNIDMPATKFFAGTSRYQLRLDGSQVTLYRSYRQTFTADNMKNLISKNLDTIKTGIKNAMHNKTGIDEIAVASKRMLLKPTTDTKSKVGELYKEYEEANETDIHDPNYKPLLAILFYRSHEQPLIFASDGETNYIMAPTDNTTNSYWYHDNGRKFKPVEILTCQYTIQKIKRQVKSAFKKLREGKNMTPYH